MLLHRQKPKDTEDTEHTPQPIITPAKSWQGEYLKNLRENRPARPTGARPLPGRPEPKTRSSIQLLDRAASAMGMYEPTMNIANELPERSSSAMSHRPTRNSLGPREMVGVPVARPPMTKMRKMSGGSDKTAQTSTSKLSDTSAGSTSQFKIPYYERGQRWIEKQEMSSLRRALEEKDLVEEQKVYESAQDEAVDLVWKHQNPGIPFANPDKPNLRAHLKKGSHARVLSNGPYENLYVRKVGVQEPEDAANGTDQGQRSASDGSQGSTGSKSGRYSSLSFSVRSSKLFGSRSSRRTSRGYNKDSIFPNSADKIYEAASDLVETVQDADKPLPLKVKARNTSYGTKSMKDKITRIEEKSENSTPVKNVSIVEIYKNPPSQSRNAQYRVNRDSIDGTKQPDPNPDDHTKFRDGMEVRGDDIRAATSMRLQDRSPKLPMPTIVSDRPGRPIVSFQKDYKPRQKDLQHEISSTRPSLDKSRPGSAPAQAPLIPTINFPDAPLFQVNDVPSIPTISLPDEVDSRSTSLPIISIQGEDTSVPSVSVSPSVPAISTPSSNTRPLPQPTKRNSPFTRPLPNHTDRPGHRSSLHWTPSSARGTAQCAACALPIAGKIVSAASQRFHPHCFSCFCCGELLECVAFYPEPDKFRAERLARIQARLLSQAIPEDQARFTEEDDGDNSLRFYCHLDFHERFSPRCKSCKTPIEGKVIVACGAEWHVGHFFCAECGDPFEADMPFVEKDGFAWCVNCHTKRYSGKCAGCRRPITDLVVTALGKEWHENCFKCKECGGDFGDGRFFTRGEDEIPVCVKCEEIRLKA